MSRSVLYMSMSVDGYIAGPNDRPGNPGGDGFMRLHEWFGFASEAGPDEEVVDPSGVGRHFLDEVQATGAVVSGRNTVEQVDHWGGDHHGSVPIFVASHWPPGPSVAAYPLVTYVTDGIASAMAQAKDAAGDRDVLVHGAHTAQTALEAGVLDELQIHQVPVLFGSGRRLFEVLPSRVELEILRVIDTPRGHTHPLPRQLLEESVRSLPLIDLACLHAGDQWRSVRKWMNPPTPREGPGGPCEPGSERSDQGESKADDCTPGKSHACLVIGHRHTHLGNDNRHQQ